MCGPTDQTDACPAFCAWTYKGREIAAFRQHVGWVVYLDRTLQHNLLFASSSDAILWLRKTVDDQTRRGRRQLGTRRVLSSRACSGAKAA
jgi:hypothetical protein